MIKVVGIRFQRAGKRRRTRNDNSDRSAFSHSGKDLLF